MRLPKPVITVYEHELLSVGERRNNIIFNEEHLHQLARLQPRLPAILYRMEYQAVRFTSVVGVIQLPQLLIEVLPKISSGLPLPRLRTAWTRLLHSSGFLPSLGNPYPQLLTQPGALVGALQQAFLQEVTQLTRQGLIKLYQTTEGQQPFLRGKLMLAQQIRHNLIRQDRFYVRTQAHQPDHPLNQRLKQALRIVKASGNPQFPTAHLLALFQHVTDLPLRQPWNGIPSLNRLTQPYQRALSLAELICKGYLGGTFVGEDFGFSLLFDMPQVFEVLVYRYLCTLAQARGWTLQYQPHHPFWHTKKLRPDFILGLPGKQRVVIDTKWKVLTSPEPNDEDLRQIFAYTQIFQAQRGILLYPHVHNLKPASQSFSVPHTQPASCEIQFIALLDNPLQQLASLLQTLS